MWTFYCEHCKKRHTHSVGEGYREAHCHNPDSPYLETSYYLIKSPEPWTAKSEATLVKLYRAGKTQGQIATLLNVPTPRVNNKIQYLIRTNRIPPRKGMH